MPNSRLPVFSLILVFIVRFYHTEAAFAVPAATVVPRPTYARYLLRRSCVSPLIRQASFNATNCAYWTAFCRNDSSLTIWPEQRSLVGKFLCIPGDPPYAFGNSSYGQCTPFTFIGISQVPTVTNPSGVTQVTVPCNFPANTIITGTATPKLLASPLPDTLVSPYVWYLTVVASSNGDFSPNYIAPDGTGGFKTTGVRPPFDTVQIISVLVQDTLTDFISNAINITFVLKTCSLRITGPASFQICNSLSTDTTIPSASYLIAPVPPGPGTGTTTIVWDDPVLISSTNGDTINYLQSQQGGTYEIPTTVITKPTITEVQVYTLSATDTAAGSNFLAATRTVTVILNTGC
ncbi:hypothetical protein BV898_03741 [Hypsibius exemplaris]|uniref:Fibronectin type-III domain-containing protein n=1 Tax=Hypsibius exemplaris TaxID=2072580 RepID=A0A1W0X422_HYPEX|nr:hypothetical protein BV898_03741 [Hypsibius exemplaris]